MNSPIESNDYTAWEMPAPEVAPDPGTGRTKTDIAEWRRLLELVIAKADANEWTKSEFARRIDMANATFSQWASGSYNGRLDRLNSKISAWLENADEMEQFVERIPRSPEFFPTAFAEECGATLNAAQALPAMVMISAAAGFGKTMTARQYVATHPHSHLCTMSPHTRTVHTMLLDVAESLGVMQANPSRISRAIGQRLQRTGGGTLLIVDEAQNLIDDAINQLRHFVDNYGCGVALLGNDEIYTRFGGDWSNGPKYGQLRRRIFKRVRRNEPLKRDILAFIKAWGITEKDQVKFLSGVGMKPGALGQIDMTVKLAKINAAGREEAMTLEDLRAAWANRDVEGL